MNQGNEKEFMINGSWQLMVHGISGSWFKVNGSWFNEG